MITQNAQKLLIVIPARYASTRLPGKPFAMICGKEMLLRVAEIAQSVCLKQPGLEYIVATDDVRIQSFCELNHINVIMTSDKCSSGTERCWEVVKEMESVDFIVNLQGDNPLCPPWFISDMINEWRNHPDGAVFTPFVHLDWQELPSFYKGKEHNPFSGTTVLIDKHGFAIAFSKQPIPAIRNQDKLQKTLEKSPIRRHIGLYGYTRKALQQYFQLEQGQYEEPEGLEQMRFIEHRIPIKMYEVNYRGRKGMNGVDSPSDVLAAEEIIRTYGEFDL